MLFLSTNSYLIQGKTYAPELKLNAIKSDLGQSIDDDQNNNLGYEKITLYLK
ncbi:hypothetical protein ACQPU1_17615 [Clostridium paraputrificum]|uniref:hypothetical protein n=1 Tax=Clostridium TaxID=1485 RepID=UPI003D33003D